jgi:DNA-binding IclR family transcriptional regulator
LELSGTIEKAVEVLFHLHREASPCGVTAIGRALGLPKSTAHRLLAALGQRGLVERDERGRYRPGIALVALGLGVLEHEPVVVAAEGVLEETAKDVGETVFLAAARSGRLIVLDKREGSGFLRAAPRVGAEIPVHATAIGKVYLAFAPALLARAPLTEFTPRTTTDPKRLAQELERVRNRGWAENEDEWTAGLAGVAAPVQLRGRLVAALAIAGPTSRLSRDQRGHFVARVRDAAEHIAARLEGTSR